MAQLPTACRSRARRVFDGTHNAMQGGFSTAPTTSGASLLTSAVDAHAAEAAPADAAAYAAGAAARYLLPPPLACHIFFLVFFFSGAQLPYSSVAAPRSLDIHEVRPQTE